MGCHETLAIVIEIDSGEVKQLVKLDGPYIPLACLPADWQVGSIRSRPQHYYLYADFKPSAIASPRIYRQTTQILESGTHTNLRRWNTHNLAHNTTRVTRSTCTCTCTCNEQTHKPSHTHHTTRMTNEQGHKTSDASAPDHRIPIRRYDAVKWWTLFLCFRGNSRAVPLAGLAALEAPLLLRRSTVCDALLLLLLLFAVALGLPIYNPNVAVPDASPRPRRDNARHSRRAARAGGRPHARSRARNVSIGSTGEPRKRIATGLHLPRTSNVCDNIPITFNIILIQL